MTLIITAATKDYVIQVADTKLTKKNGEFYDDRLVKTTIVHCIDSKLVLSYTGLAFLNGIRTDKWITRVLRIFRVWEKGFPETVEFLTNILTQTIDKNRNLETIGLTIIIAGLGINGGKRDFAFAQISNNQEYNHNDLKYQFQDINPRGRKFNKIFFTTNKNFKHFVSMDGAMNAEIKVKGFIRAIENRVVKIKTNKDINDLINIIVAMLRQHRAEYNLSKLIGEDCTAVVIDKTYKSTSFFYSKNTNVRRYPNIISKSLAIENFEFKID